MRKGCLYWIFIGFWLEPIILIFKLFFGLASYNEKTHDDDTEDYYYTDNDLDEIKEDMRSDIEDELRDKLEWEIRQEIENEYYGNTSLVSSKVKHKDKKEIEKMYDKEKGIYPSGQYLVGEDIEKGRYLLVCNEEGIIGAVSIYENYKKYKSDEMMTYNSFNKDYHLSIREDGLFIVVENADIQKI